MNDHIVSIIVAILTGLATCVPLAVKLYQSVKEAIQEKNWPHLLGLVVDLMEEAEEKFTDGATRKEWVMAMVQTSAEYINYPVDTQALSDMIDALCDMTKIVNPPAVEELAEESTTDAETEGGAGHDGDRAAE